MAGDQRLAALPGSGRAAKGRLWRIPSPTTSRRLPGEERRHRIEEQPAQLGELRPGGDLGLAAAAAGEEIAGPARHLLDLGAPGQLEALQGIGRDGPEEAPLLAQPVLQQQGVAVEQLALDLGGAPGPRLGQGGVAGIAGAQAGPHPVELVPAAPELRLDRPQQLRGGGVLGQAGLAGDQDVDLVLELPLAGVELRGGSAAAESVPPAASPSSSERASDRSLTSRAAAAWPAAGAFRCISINRSIRKS